LLSGLLRPNATAGIAPARRLGIKGDRIVAV
jgi:hypothetical protein